MKKQTLKDCMLLILNRDRIKSVFPLEGGFLQLAGAGVLTAKGIAADTAALASCRDLLKQKAGVFSNFRSFARLPIVAALTASDHPEQVLDDGLTAYRTLRRLFWASTYLPIAAMTVAQLSEPPRFEEVAARARGLYDRIKEEHRFSASGENGALCALMALSGRSDDTLIEDTEQCYRILKPNFFYAGAVLALSQALALCNAPAGIKCARIMEVFDKLKAAGYKFGTYYELPTLGVWALSSADSSEIVQEMCEISDWLSQQRGFGFFSGIDRKHRLMYAGILAQRGYLDDKLAQAASVDGVISFAIAQEAAVFAAVAASATAAASAASSS